MTQSRRNFLATGGAVLTGAAGLTAAPLAAGIQAPTATKPAGRIKLALSTYSYWHFRDPKVSIETVIDKAARSASRASTSCIARWTPRTRRRCRS